MQRPSIALLIQTASAWSNEMLRGIAEYAHEHGPWDFFLEPRGPYERLKLPKHWRMDGVIARVDHAALENAIRRQKLPAVNVSWYRSHSRAIPKVVSDQAACAKLAAEHLIELGFRHIGYVGPVDRRDYHDQLGEVFVEHMRAAGVTCRTLGGSGNRNEIALDAARLRRWVKQLPKPAAVLAWSDRFGRELMQAAASLRAVIPDDLAILSAERDPLISALSPIPLSSLDMAPNRVGYEAAALLDRLLQGDPPPEEPVLIPPVGVIQRRSTDTVSVNDEEVAQALRYIREFGHEPIRVEDLLDVVPLSRRALEQRFQKALGRSPAAEIRRSRLERAKRMLVETDLPLTMIAERCGFNHPEVMIRNFQSYLGVSPGRFRRRG